MRDAEHPGDVLRARALLSETGRSSLRRPPLASDKWANISLTIGIVPGGSSFDRVSCQLIPLWRCWRKTVSRFTFTWHSRALTSRAAISPSSAGNVGSSSSVPALPQPCGWWALVLLGGLDRGNHLKRSYREEAAPRGGGAHLPAVPRSNPFPSSCACNPCFARPIS